MQHLMNTYGRLPVAFARGSGAWLWDTNGKRYLDALCGIAVSGLGHAHPRLTGAIAEQAGRLIHASNLYRIPEQEALADHLCGISTMDRVFSAIRAARRTRPRSSSPACTAISATSNRR
jgi:acetylornithine/N-succinyldiaminopimelate aminotransferase